MIFTNFDKLNVLAHIIVALVLTAFTYLDPMQKESYVDVLLVMPFTLVGFFFIGKALSKE